VKTPERTTAAAFARYANGQVVADSASLHQNRVRANAQLIDAESGAHIWADRFEVEMADLFKRMRLTNPTYHFAAEFAEMGG
jgi:TolB-like protein